MSNQMFLKLDGVEGESTDVKHKGEIDLLGWTWGLSELAPASGGGSVKVAIGTVSIQKLVNSSSPALLLHAAEGQRIASGVLTTRHASGGEFLLVKMTDVLVSSVAVTALNDANQVAETVALAFGKIEFDYRPTLPNGNLGSEKSFRWDVGTNRPF